MREVWDFVFDAGHEEQPIGVFVVEHVLLEVAQQTRVLGSDVKHVLAAYSAHLAVVD